MHGDITIQKITSSKIVFYPHSAPSRLWWVIHCGLDHWHRDIPWALALCFCISIYGAIRWLSDLCSNQRNGHINGAVDVVFYCCCCGSMKVITDWIGLQPLSMWRRQILRNGMTEWECTPARPMPICMSEWTNIAKRTWASRRYVFVEVKYMTLIHIDSEPLHHRSILHLTISPFSNLNLFECTRSLQFFSQFSTELLLREKNNKALREGTRYSLLKVPDRRNVSLC